MDSKELDNLFKSDKTDWYSENKNGTKTWDISKLDHFWNMIKIHKILKNDFKFDGFVFPSFYRTNPPLLNANAIYFHEVFGSGGLFINTRVIFSNCRFSGPFIIPNLIIPDYKTSPLVIFKSDLTFEDCVFEENFKIQYTSIHGDFTISSCIFRNEFSLTNCQLFKKSNLNFNLFEQRLLLHGNTFNDNTNLSENNFNGLCQIGSNKSINLFSIISSTFNKEVRMYNNNYLKTFTLASTKFEDNVLIHRESFVNGGFSNLEFLGKKSLFRDISIKENQVLKLRNIFFQDNFYFFRCDCNNIVFMESNIVKPIFDSCKWNITHRLLIKDETDLKFINTSNYLKLENIYRQLKKNFDGQKDWELSGYAYISEMEMRKNRLLHERKYASFFIYWFYGFFGGYTQNFLRPIISLAILTLVCTIVYFLIDYNVINALERGLKGSIPYIEIRENEPYPRYWLLLKNIQLILSGTFLSFFILALRKRFKQ
ncbi:hypothetical protein [Lacinutrix sp. MEBiC02404]